MLQEQDAAHLDASLLKLMCLIDAQANTAAITGLARRIVEDLADDGKPDAIRRKVVRAGWERTWKDIGAVTSGWFWDPTLPGVLDERSADALHDAVTAMVRLVLDGTTAYLQRRYAAQVRDVCAVYLSLRGVERVPGAVSR